MINRWITDRNCLKIIKEYLDFKSGMIIRQKKLLKKYF